MSTDDPISVSKLAHVYTVFLHIYLELQFCIQGVQEQYDLIFPLSKFSAVRY